MGDSHLGFGDRLVSCLKPGTQASSLNWEDQEVLVEGSDSDPTYGTATFSSAHKALEWSFSAANPILSLPCLKLSTALRINTQAHTRQAWFSLASSVSSLHLASPPLCLILTSYKPHHTGSHSSTFCTSVLDSSFLPCPCLCWLPSKSA